MKKVILLSSFLIVVGCCDFKLDLSGMFGDPVSPTPPPPYVNLDVQHYGPSAVYLDSLTQLVFDIGWDIDTVLVGYSALNIWLAPYDTAQVCHIFADTLRTAKGQMKITAKYIFRHQEGYVPFAGARVYLATTEYSQRDLHYIDYDIR